MTGGSGWQLLEALALGPFMSGRKMTNHLATANQADLICLIPLLEAGNIGEALNKSSRTALTKYMDELVEARVLTPKEKGKRFTTLMMI
jgi:hypothetical protein